MGVYCGILKTVKHTRSFIFIFRIDVRSSEDKTFSINCKKQNLILTPYISPNITANAGKLAPTKMAAIDPITIYIHSGEFSLRIRLKLTLYFLTSSPSFSSSSISFSSSSSELSSTLRWLWIEFCFLKLVRLFLEAKKVSVHNSFLVQEMFVVL